MEIFEAWNYNHHGRRERDWELSKRLHVSTHVRPPRRIHPSLENREEEESRGDILAYSRVSDFFLLLENGNATGKCTKKWERKMVEEMAERCLLLFFGKIEIIETEKEIIESNDSLTFESKQKKKTFPKTFSMSKFGNLAAGRLIIVSHSSAKFFCMQLYNYIYLYIYKKLKTTNFHATFRGGVQVFFKFGQNT